MGVGLQKSPFLRARREGLAGTKGWFGTPKHTQSQSLKGTLHSLQKDNVLKTRREEGSWRPPTVPIFTMCWKCELICRPCKWQMVESVNSYMKGDKMYKSGPCRMRDTGVERNGVLRSLNLQ